MRLIDADELRQRLNPDDWGTPDERWRPEREFGELIDYAPTIDQWHYPSEGDYPTESGIYLAACKTDDGLLARSIKFYDAKFKKWESYIEVYAWCELLDLPKDTSLEKQVRVPYSYLLNQPPKEEA